MDLLVNTETRNVHDPNCRWVAGCMAAGGLNEDHYVVTDETIARKLVGGSFQNHICSWCAPSVGVS
jgi:hypothetical protein